MKKIFAASLILSLAIACAPSPQEKAEALVKEAVQKSLYIPDSYEAVDTQLDSAFTPYHDPAFVATVLDMCKKGVEMDELEIDAKVENLDQVLSFVDSRLEARDCPAGYMMNIDIAVEEIFVNIASYAYDGGPGKAWIRIGFEEYPHTMVLTFIDKGKPFDPVSKPDPDVTLSAEERKIGGLGIFMVKKSMDTMEYTRKDDSNILTITKKI